MGSACGPAGGSTAVAVRGGAGRGRAVAVLRLTPLSPDTQLGRCDASPDVASPARCCALPSASPGVVVGACRQVHVNGPARLAARFGAAGAAQQDGLVGAATGQAIPRLDRWALEQEQRRLELAAGRNGSGRPRWSAPRYRAHRGRRSHGLPLTSDHSSAGNMTWTRAGAALQRFPRTIRSGVWVVSGGPEKGGPRGPRRAPERRQCARLQMWEAISLPPAGGLACGEVEGPDRWSLWYRAASGSEPSAAGIAAASADRVASFKGSVGLLLGQLAADANQVGGSTGVERWTRDFDRWAGQSQTV